MPENGRNDHGAYNKAKLLDWICMTSSTRKFALMRVREKFPDEDLTHVAKHCASYLKLPEN